MEYAKDGEMYEYFLPVEEWTKENQELKVDKIPCNTPIIRG